MSRGIVAFIWGFSPPGGPGDPTPPPSLPRPAAGFVPRAAQCSRRPHGGAGAGGGAGSGCRPRPPLLPLSCPFSPSSPPTSLLPPSSFPPPPRRWARTRLRAPFLSLLPGTPPASPARSSRRSRCCLCSRGRRRDPPHCPSVYTRAPVAATYPVLHLLRGEILASSWAPKSHSSKKRNTYFPLAVYL